MTNKDNKIGKWQGAGLLATTLLGTGVFILPQMTIAIAGYGALWSWLLLTLAIIPVTYVFATLAAKYPHAGGPAFFVEQAFGRIAGRSIGLIFLLIVPIGVPAAILMTIQFAQSLIPLPGYQLLFGELFIVAILFLLNYRGVQISAKLQFIITLAVISVVLLLLAAFGLLPSSNESMVASKVQSQTILSAAGIAFWSFLGVEAMTHLAEEFRNPKKDMVPSMLIGTCLVGLIYVACTLLLLWLPVNSHLSMIGVFNQLLGGYGELVIGVLGVAGGLSSANVYTASTTRLMWSLSKDGVLPSSLGKTNQHQVPIRALMLILCIMVVVLILSFLSNKNLEHLIAWCNGVFVIIYFASMAAAVKLLGKKHLPYIMLGFVFCFALGWGLGAQMLYATVLLSVVLPLLWWQSHHQSKKWLSA